MAGRTQVLAEVLEDSSGRLFKQVYFSDVTRFLEIIITKKLILSLNSLIKISFLQFFLSFAC